MAHLSRAVGAAAIVAVPALLLVADELRMTVEPEAAGTLVDSGFGVESMMAELAAIEADRGTFVLSASLSYLAVLLSIPLVVAVWRLTVPRAPGWAWTSAALGALGVAGGMVHVSGYYGMSLMALEVEDRRAAAEMLVQAESVPFVVALFAPFFLSLLVWVPQAIGLYRAGVVPLWSPVAVGVGAAVFMTVGSTPWSTAVWTGLLLAGFLPAARAVLRVGPLEVPAPERTPVAAAA